MKEKMKNLLTLIPFIFLLATGVAFAQSTDAYKEKCEEMLVLMNTDSTYTLLVKHFTSMHKQKHPDVPEEFWEEFEKEFKDASWSYLINGLSSVYSNYYTLSELEELIKFYESPIGKKVTEHGNAISEESNGVFNEWIVKFKQEMNYKLEQNGIID